MHAKKCAYDAYSSCLARNSLRCQQIEETENAYESIFEYLFHYVECIISLIIY